jgi:hypothetical protein
MRATPTSKNAMSAKPVLYSVRHGDRHATLRVDSVWAPDDAEILNGTYTHLVPLAVGERLLVLAVENGTNVSAFRFTGSDPWFAPIESHIDLDGSWDLIEPFALGNIPHLLAYAADEGQFSFIPLDGELRSAAPYRYSRRREGATAGFDVVNPISVGGLLYYLCYSFESGQVNIYSLVVTPTSSPNSAPLLSQPVWVHRWASNWTRFAFFQLGGENFFLKTNVGRLNVNIDHVRNSPENGTAEVGTSLDLEDALELDSVASFYLDQSNPYFVTYMKSGKTTFNRFHGDCRGWTTEARLDAAGDATHVVPLQAGDECYLLLC